MEKILYTYTVNEIQVDPSGRPDLIFYLHSKLLMKGGEKSCVQTYTVHMALVIGDYMVIIEGFSEK